VRQRPLGLLVTLPLVGVAATPALVGFDPANPDAYGYLAVAVALGAVAAVALVAALLSRLGPRPATAGAALLCSLVLLRGALGAQRVTLSRQYDADRTFAAWLSSAPPRGLVVTSYFQTIFGLYYLVGVEGQRADTTVVHRHFLGYPGYRSEMLYRSPSLAPLLAPRASAGRSPPMRWSSTTSISTSG
jgi:hypothetical protein